MRDLGYWEEACALFALTKEEQALAKVLLEGPMEIGRAVELLKGGAAEDFELSPVFGHDQREIWLYPVFSSYVKGEIPDSQNGSLPEGLRLEFPEPQKAYGAEELLEELKTFFSRAGREQSRCCVLSGQDGKTFIARQSAYRVGRPLLVWNGGNVPETEVWLTAFLYDALICLAPEESEEDVNEGAMIGEAIRLCEMGLDLLALSSDEKRMEGLTKEISCLHRNVPVPDDAQKSSFLEDYLESHLYKEDEFLKRAVRRTLIKESVSIAQMERMLRELELEYRIGENKAQDRYLSEECVTAVLSRYQKKTGETAGIRKMAANRSLQDLCLPQEHHKKLRLICEMLKNRDKVLEEWGFSEKYSYGNGISILFYGAPGTGKTMAAQAIASELEMPLYRVDLSELISKYIGETQKNIAKVFEQAKTLRGILLFDEADALFSRRNEVSDAQDKYANAETAYLLQRIEESDGICILTTNLFQNFDEAFRRRITYMINFPMPDAALRGQLWRNVFPKETPLAEDLDFDLLAENFELSGAAIRNAAMQSAWMASAGQECVTMQNVLSGIANECRKINRALKPDQKALMELYDALLF